MPEKKDRENKAATPVEVSGTARKDKTTKKLEDYADVFADIVNVLLFRDSPIDPGKLRDAPTESFYKAESGALRGQFRDTMKYLEDAGIIIAEIGLENQSSVDETMPVRVLGYDYASYRRQLDSWRGRQDRQLERTPLRPVITVVLNFSDTPWRGPLSLKEMFRIPEGMEAFVQDYRINVFDIAYLDDATVNRFRSTFRHVAHFFVNSRIYGAAYQPLDEEIEHLPEFLDFLQVFTSESRYAEITPALVARQQKGGAVTMFNVLDYHWNRGLEDGKKAGMEIGLKEGLAEGLEKGMEKGQACEKLSMIDKLVASQICSFEKACEVAEITPAEYEEMKRKLEKDNGERQGV